MAKPRNEIFTVLGTIESVEGVHRFVPSSPGHMRACVSRISLKKRIACTFSEDDSTRSEQQLRYHFVLIGYLADYSGTTTAEMHEAVMILKFGTKTIRIANKEVKVRKSISKSGHLTKTQVMELIDFDLSLCADMQIAVPTKEELGYLPN